MTGPAYRKTGLGLALAATTALTATSAAQAETMIVATDLPPTHFVSVQGVERLMNCITEAAGDEIDFNYFPSGQLVKRDEGVSALQKGLAQLTFSTIAAETATVPLQSVTVLPGMFESAVDGVEAWRAAISTDGALKDELESVGIKPIQMSLLAPYQIMGTQNYADIADWQGKKIRTTGSALNFLVDSIGAVSVEMSANDLYTAMQRGTVDGTILSFASATPYSVNEVATHMSENASFGTSASWIGMSQEYFDSLSPEHQQIVDECGKTTELELAAWVDENEGRIRDEYREQGIEIYELSDDQLAAFSEAMAPVENDFVSRLESRDLPAQEALDLFKEQLAN